MKQIIEIEVPAGKKAVWENNQIKFVDNEHWKNIKTFEDAFDYCNKNNICSNLLGEYEKIPHSCSYEHNIIKLRIIIAALTNNEKLSLTKGDVWRPVVQFCDPDEKDNYLGNKLIGKIKSNNEEYLVVGGMATKWFGTGLSGYSYYGYSYGEIFGGLIQVSSKEIAKHLSTYFGKLIFNVTYGGCNCDYEWVE